MTSTPPAPVIAMLGLGEAGTAFTTDLVAAGAVVRAYDPARSAPEGAVACAGEADAVIGADLVICVTTAAYARAALDAALPALGKDALWADLNTADPQLMRDLDATVTGRGARFVDVSIMAPVPDRGLTVPLLASGTAADDFARTLTRYGAHVDVLDGGAGAAAERKLLRSVFYKGMSAAIVEALAAARESGLEPWLADNIASELAAFSRDALTRIVTGTHLHARRRADEMDAAAKMLDDLHVPSTMAHATADSLHRIAATQSHHETLTTDTV